MSNTTKPRRPRSRANGTGTAVQIGKVWQARVVVGWKPSADGTHKIPVWRTKSGFHTKKDAINYCATLLAEKTGNKAVPNLLHYWQQYESADLEKLSRDKQYAYKGAWKKLSDLHYRLVDSITVADLRAVVSAKAKTYYPARDMKTLLSHLFRLAGADGFANASLPDFIPLPSMEEKERTPFTADEQKALWQAYENGDRRAAIPLIMIYTGAMPGEIRNLRKDAVHIDDQQIIGAGMKTKVRKKSPIFLPDVIVPVMIEELQQSDPDSEYVWSRDEKRFYADYYAVLESAGCRRLEPYSCRHTTATALAVDNNIAPQTIRKIMRWSTTKMLDRYAHPDDSAAVTALNTLKK